MPNLAAMLKSEITRLAKKAVKEQVGPIHAASTAHRKHIASLKRQVLALQKEVGQLRRSPALRATTSRDAPADADAGKLRFQARGLRSLRAKLELSAEDFGRLAGVSGQSVYNWETEKTVPRLAQVQKIASLRSLGKRGANAQLEAMR